jgi:hypothetical protein
MSLKKNIFTKDLYDKNKLMVKNMNDNNLLNTLKKHPQFQKCEILKF